MPGRINRARLKAFIARRKTNALGLTIITAASAIITLICAMISFKRTNVLAFITVLLVVLCLIQAIKYKKSFRTMKSAKGFKKKKSP